VRRRKGDVKERGGEGGKGGPPRVGSHVQNPEKYCSGDYVMNFA